MKETLKVIVETDKASRLDVEKAKQRRENLTEELTQKKEKIQSEYKLNAENEVSKARENAKAEIDNVSAEIDKITKAKSDELDKAYNENHLKWEDAIYSAVIK